MPDFRDLDPARLKPGLVTGDGDLKPGLVTPAYTGGRPTAANQVKPSLLLPNGDLKPGLVLGDDLKPSLVTGAAPQLLLLDNFPGSAVAYSLRRIRANQINCIRVRRSADSLEQDIGFSGNAINTNLLLSFVGSGDGFITRWYDQSGNANDAVQALTTQQAQIVSGGTLVTDGGRVAALWNNGFFSLTNSVSSATWSIFGLSRKTSGQLVYFARAIGNPYSYANWNDGNLYLGDSSGFRSAPAIASRVLICTHDQTTDDLVLRRNGIPVTMSGKTSLGGGGTVFDSLGRTTNTNSNGYIQEALFWQASQVVNQVAIEANINSYWGVY